MDWVGFRARARVRVRVRVRVRAARVRVRVRVRVRDYLRHHPTLLVWETRPQRHACYGCDPPH
jgi:hypothetical protein